jgi:hypothetical protein
VDARPYRPGGRPYGRAAGAAALVLLAGACVPRAAHATRVPEPRGDAPDFLACRSTVVRNLESGDVHSYQFVANQGEALTIEAVDVSGTIELLRFRLYLVGGPGLGSTCTGRMPMRAPTTGVYVLEVRDCIGNDAGKYALNLNVVSDTEHSCGVPLACGVERSGDLEVGGQVDSYAFYGAENEPVALDFESTLDGRGGLEVRVFDPDGFPAFQSCGSSFDFNLPKTGRYTVLVNACLGKNTGEYTLAWRSRSCPTHVGAHSGGGGIGVRLSNDNTAVVQIAASSLSCAYNDSSGFVLDLNPPVPITNGRFSTVTSSADSNSRPVQVDGVFVGDGSEQLLGGMSVPFGNARCNFQWAANNQTDADWDGWSDEQETALGSRPGDADSVPENRLVPATGLFGTGVCRDYYDNDADDAVDGFDVSCFGGQLPSQPTFAAFAGRHSGGAAFSLERSADGTRVTRLLTPAIDCGATASRALALEVDIPIANDRFSARIGSGGDGLVAAVDGVFFDGDNDGTREQALGGISLRGGDCLYTWWASAHVDTDGDGWGDAAERRHGSDPRPLPAGAGMNSTPEDISLPVTILADVSVCSDGVDNDLNEATDFADSKCFLPTATPTATVPASPTQPPAPTRSPTPPPTNTRVLPTGTPTPTSTPENTLPPTATRPPTLTPTPTQAIACLPQGAVKVERSVSNSYLPGGVVEVTLQVQVDETAVPNGAVVVETLPPGWVLETAEPDASSISRPGGQVRWLFVGGQVADTTLRYRARAGLGSLAPVHICGSALFNEPANVPRCVLTGCSGLVSLPVHPADRNIDERIEDAELLAWIDRWTLFEIDDQDLLDSLDLWAAQCNDGSTGCYCLDPGGGVGPRQFRPGECES